MRIDFSFSETPQEEIRKTFCRKPHTRFSEFSSLKGRMVCLAWIPVHLVAIVGKTAVYATIFFLVGSLITPIFCLSLRKAEFRSLSKECFFVAMENLGCALATPIGQLAQLIKATAGAIIHPGAYFKRTPMYTYVEQKHSLFICCDFEQPVNAPAETIHSLAAELRQHSPLNIHVQYFGQAGDDFGGLRRDFFGRLATALADRLETRERIVQWTPPKHVSLQAIGSLFKFLIEHAQKMPGDAITLGDNFAPAYFKGILAFAHAEAQADFDQIPRGRLLEIAATLVENRWNSLYIKSLQALALWDGFHQSFEQDQEMTSFIRENYGVRDGSPLPSGSFNASGALNLEYLEPIRNAMMDDFLAPHILQLQSLHAIAAGMSKGGESQWKSLQELGACHVQESIIGKFDKEGLIKVLQITNFSEEKKRAITAWVKEKTAEELKQLLFNVTGSESISPAGLSIEQIPRNKGSAHSCGHTLHLPRSATTKGLLTILEDYCVSGAFGFELQ